MPPARTLPLRPALWLLLLLAAGVAVRMAWWPQTFQADGVMLQPTDSPYYARFAQLQLRTFPRFDPFDAWVNAPEGAAIIWPALHTGLVMLGARAAGPGHEEAGVAFVDTAAFLLDSVLLWWLLRRRGGELRAWLGVAAVGLLPAVSFNTGLGNADHHVHEPYLAAATAWLFAEALAAGSARHALWAGALAGAARLLTPLGFLLLFPVAAALPLYALRHREQATPWGRMGLALGAGAAAASWAFALLFGEVRSLSYVAWTSFHPLASLAAGLAAGALAEGLRDGRRAVRLLGAAVLVAAPLLPELRHGLQDLVGKDALLAAVQESQPGWAHPDWLWDMLGLLGAVSLGLLLVVARDFRAHGSPWAALTLVTAAAWMACTLLQVRFVQPAAGPLALGLALGLESLLATAAPRQRALAWAVLALALAHAVTVVVQRVPTWEDGPMEEARLRPVMAFLRERTPAPGDTLDGRARPAWTVVAGNDWGHLVTLWGGRAAVATPFSQAPVHVRGNARTAAVLSAQGDDEAWRLCGQTAARYVLVTPGPVAGATPEQLAGGLHRRLLQHAGMRQGDASGHFALVFDAPGGRAEGDARPFGRLFEVVPGALLEGTATPGSEVRAELSLRSNTGELLKAVHTTRPGEDGRYRLRVALASEPLGEVTPLGPWQVVADGAAQQVAVSAEAVRSGHAVPVHQ